MLKLNLTERFPKVPNDVALEPDYIYYGWPNRAYTIPDPPRHQQPGLDFRGLVINVQTAIVCSITLYWLWEWWLARKKKAPDVTTPGAPQSSL